MLRHARRHEQGDCHASCHKGIVGFSVNSGVLRCRLRAGCGRWRWYGRRRRRSRRQRRWTGRNGVSDAQWKRHYRFDIRDRGFKYDGSVAKKRAAENEYGDDGRACLRQRNKEALLTALLGGPGAGGDSLPQSRFSSLLTGDACGVWDNPLGQAGRRYRQQRGDIDVK
jgi:hypothetical protein